MQNINTRDESFKQDDALFFRKALQILDNLTQYSIPQHEVLTEDDFLKEIGLVRHKQLVITTSLESMNFAEVGVFPVLIRLTHTGTNEHSVRVIYLNIYPSKKRYTKLKNVYWRAYGLVIEGQLSYSQIENQNKNDFHYNVELVHVSGQNMTSKPVRLYDWYSSSKKDSFHSVFENSELTNLVPGSYHIRIKSCNIKTEEERISRFIEKESERRFLSIESNHSLTKQLEKRVIDETSIELCTLETGEVQMNIYKNNI